MCAFLLCVVLVAVGIMFLATKYHIAGYPLIGLSIFGGILATVLLEHYDNGNSLSNELAEGLGDNAGLAAIQTIF